MLVQTDDYKKPIVDQYRKHQTKCLLCEHIDLYTAITTKYDVEVDGRFYKSKRECFERSVVEIAQDKYEQAKVVAIDREASLDEILDVFDKFYNLEDDDTVIGSAEDTIKGVIQDFGSQEAEDYNQQPMQRLATLLLLGTSLLKQEKDFYESFAQKFASLAPASDLAINIREKAAQDLIECSAKHVNEISMHMNMDGEYCAYIHLGGDRNVYSQIFQVSPCKVELFDVLRLSRKVEVIWYLSSSVCCKLQCSGSILLFLFFLLCS